MLRRVSSSLERSRLPGVALAALSIVSVATVLTIRAQSLMRYIEPALFGDEMGALFTARWLTGSGALPSMGTDSYYAPGFGILLAPVEALTNTPVGTYRAALLTNLALVAMCVPLLYWIVRQTTQLTRSSALLVATATWCSASLVVHSSLTWSESLVSTSLLATIALFLRLDRHPSLLWAIALSAACAVSYLAHSRMIVLILAVMLGVLAASWFQRIPAHVTVAFLLATIALLLAVRGLVIEPHRSALWTRRTGRAILPPDETLTSIDGLRATLTLLLGHLWYAGVATLGLSAVATWHLGRRLARARWRARTHDDAVGLSIPAAVVILSGLLGMIVVSVGFFAAPSIPRADIAFYGRYVAPFLLPATALGLAVAMSADVELRSRVAVALSTGGLLVLLGALLALLGESVGLHDKPRNAFNVAGVEIALRTMGKQSFAMIAGAAGFVLLGLLLVRPRRLAAPAAAVVLLVPALSVTEWAERNNHNSTSTIAHRIADVPGSRVAAIGSGAAPAPYLVQFHNVHVKVERTSTDGLDEQPCVLVTGGDVGDALRRRGYVLRVGEARSPTQLWTIPEVAPDEGGSIVCIPPGGDGRSESIATQGVET